jgi:UDP-N-acetylglucosamine--N-acetylmuramyl-(pentapeptide) pyrophosphoryl-undecaprenol N-acetylglucosamine transferase
VLAARLLGNRPKIVLHEQNAVLGRANRLLARGADLLVLSFVKTKAVPAGIAMEVLGDPVRPAITALHAQGFVPPGQRVELLVLGGSLGAKIFGTLIPAALALLPADLRARLHVVQQCRTQELDEARAIFAAAGIDAELSPFFADVAERLRRAHLVIARAGASTVAEIAVAGRPAIFIPLPNAIDDHQRANAEALAEQNAAWVAPQAGLTPQSLAARIESVVMNPETLKMAADRAAQAGRPEAASSLAETVLRMVAEQVRP